MKALGVSAVLEIKTGGTLLSRVTCHPVTNIQLEPTCSGEIKDWIWYKSEHRSLGQAIEVGIG